jgi:hypothetical protein
VCSRRSSEETSEGRWNSASAVILMKSRIHFDL